jgi:hypothetical protein
VGSAQSVPPVKPAAGRRAGPAALFVSLWTCGRRRAQPAAWCAQCARGVHVRRRRHCISTRLLVLVNQDSKLALCVYSRVGASYVGRPICVLIVPCFSPRQVLISDACAIGSSANRSASSTKPRHCRNMRVDEPPPPAAADLCRRRSFLGIKSTYTGVLRNMPKEALPTGARTARILLALCLLPIRPTPRKLRCSRIALLLSASFAGTSEIARFYINDEVDHNDDQNDIGSILTVTPCRCSLPFTLLSARMCSWSRVASCTGS